MSKDPKGLEWLWSPQIVGLYNRLLQRCELNPHTTEAAAGALQNITAGDRRVRPRAQPLTGDAQRVQGHTGEGWRIFCWGGTAEERKPAEEPTSEGPAGHAAEGPLRGSKGCEASIPGRAGSGGP